MSDFDRRIVAAARRGQAREAQAVESAQRSHSISSAGATGRKVVMDPRLIIVPIPPTGLSLAQTTELRRLGLAQADHTRWIGRCINRPAAKALAAKLAAAGIKGAHGKPKGAPPPSRIDAAAAAREAKELLRPPRPARRRRH